MARTCVVRLAARRLTFPGQILPRSRGTRHVGLAAQSAFHTDLSGHGGYLLGENRQRLGHVVDRLGQCRDLALGLHRQALLQVAVGDGGHDLHDAADLFGQVGRHDVDVVRQVLPRTGDARHHRLAAELALGAHLTGHARHFRGEGD
jgi:hypothetical protein